MKITLLFAFFLAVISFSAQAQETELSSATGIRGAYLGSVIYPGFHMGIERPYKLSIEDTVSANNLHLITVPTLLLWGKYDFVCPPGLADDIELNIGSADVEKIIFDESGHSPMYNERDHFWNVVIEWINAH